MEIQSHRRSTMFNVVIVISIPVLFHFDI